MKNLLRYGLPGVRILAGGLILGGAYAGIAVGQGLPSVPGITDLQKPVAVTLQNVCIALNGLGGNPPETNADDNGALAIQRLAASCSKMVVTAFANQSPSPGLRRSPSGPFDLNISDEELKRGIQAIAPVQANSQKQISVESSKMSMVGSRLLDLRGGTRGLVVGSNGQDATESAYGQGSGLLAGAKGGAAGPDDALSGRWGGFVNFGYAWGNVDQTPLQDAYKYGSFSVLAGADYRVTDAFVLGAAFNYSDTHSDYDQSLGNVKARTSGVSVYGTYYMDAWYVDALIGYGSVDYDSTRNIFIPSNNPLVRAINTSATASPNGQQWSGSIGIGRGFETGTMTVTPTARLGYIRVKNNGFSEFEPNDGLGLTVDARTIKSMQTAVGGKVSTVVNSSTAVFGPYFTAQWMHEFKGGTPSIVSKYVADPQNTIFAIPTATPTRNYGVFTIGTSATFPNNLTGFVQFSGAAGLNNETNYGVVLGARKQF